MANSIDETLKAIEREQKERQKENEEQVGQSSNQTTKSLTWLFDCLKYNRSSISGNGWKQGKETKGKGREKEKVVGFPWLDQGLG